jgi:hypothetical protein
VGFIVQLSSDYCSSNGTIMNFISPEKRRVTPQQAVKILKQHGTIVTLEEAKLILDFLYKFGKLAIDQYVKV